MYQQYLKDPESVDKAWWDFFADYQPEQQKPGDAAATDGATRSTASGNGHAPAPTAPERKPDATVEEAPAKPAAPKQDAPAPKSQPAPAAAAPEAGAKPLKGAAARVVSNMEASLSVPTATSVRAIPAKLLIDNRVVINNHLRRGRGGKVSFTHLIGYALVKALAEFPAMNRAFTEIDGKPGIVDPEHVNVGL